jgi:hypothetical protein
VQDIDATVQAERRCSIGNKVSSFSRNHLGRYINVTRGMVKHS